ncbi:MAG: glycerol-3-phosphate responsive antiterminator [Terrisporobacter sp.]|uniref:glycerol-3-phosphate responsive antiterminator n=1 Tax=Terrisporobacter sp. TaxID=1965305 RepID=UPI002FCA960E
MKELLECNPIIGAIKGDEDLERVINSDCNVVFLLSGDILTLKDKVNRLKLNGKSVFVHLDMIGGISSNPVIIKYLKTEFHVDGIITTKNNLVKKALEENVNVVQRIFLLDSISLQTSMQNIRRVKPSAIEIMPGVITKAVRTLHKAFPDLPIICGGLIDDKQEIIDVLKNGAMAVSTTKKELW